MLLKTSTINCPNTPVHTVYAELAGAKSYDWTKSLVAGEQSTILEASAADKQDPERREGGGEVRGRNAEERGEEGLDKVSVDKEAEEDNYGKSGEGRHRCGGK